VIVAVKQGEQVNLYKVYFDSCCYVRPWDNQKIARHVAETIAILTAIEALHIAGHAIVGSMAISFELGNNPNVAQRIAIMRFYADTVDETVNLTSADFGRALSLQGEGVGAMDSQHLVAAEVAGASYLLTVDDDFERIVTKKNLSKVNVINPLTYLAGGII